MSEASQSLQTRVQEKGKSWSPNLCHFQSPLHFLEAVFFLCVCVGIVPAGWDDDFTSCCLTAVLGISPRKIDFGGFDFGGWGARSGGGVRPAEVFVMQMIFSGFLSLGKRKRLDPRFPRFPQ